MFVSQVILLQKLSVYRAVHQLDLNKTEKKKEKSAIFQTTPLLQLSWREKKSTVYMMHTNIYVYMGFPDSSVGEEYTNICMNNHWL